jgi:hypothetical protein
MEADVFPIRQAGSARRAAINACRGDRIVEGAVRQAIARHHRLPARFIFVLLNHLFTMTHFQRARTPFLALESGHLAIWSSRH